MNLTFKAWCLKCGFHWYGPGIFSEHPYDFKVSLGKGRNAFFTNEIDGYKPVAYFIGNRYVVFFPDFTGSLSGGVLSEALFREISAWIAEGLDGDLHSFRKT